MHVVRRLGNSSAPFEANFRYIGCLFQNYSDIEEEEAENGDGDDDDQDDNGEDDDGDDVLTVRSKGGQSPTGARILTSHLPGHAHQQQQLNIIKNFIISVNIVKHCEDHRIEHGKRGVIN